MDQEDAKSLYLQLYWLFLNGLVTADATFAVDQAPFGPTARFRLNYSVIRTFDQQPGRHRAELLSRFVLVVTNSLPIKYHEPVKSSTRRSEPRTCTSTLAQPLMETLAPKDAIGKAAVFGQACCRLQTQFQLPVEACDVVYPNMMANPQVTYGLGYWIALCDYYQLTKSNTLHASILKMANNANVEVHKFFETRNHVQWTTTTAMSNQREPSPNPYETDESRKRKYQQHFETYLPEAKRVFDYGTHDRCSDGDNVIVMPSTVYNGGLGVFVVKPIEAGQCVTNYCGIVNVASTQKPSSSADEKDGDDKFDQTHILALSYGNAAANVDGLRYPLAHQGVASLVNSSSDRANAVFKIHCKNLSKWATIVAKRRLEVGEEVFVNYPII